MKKKRIYISLEEKLSIKDILEKEKATRRNGPLSILLTSFAAFPPKYPKVPTMLGTEITSAASRHISLNNYDYDYLKGELSLLSAEVGNECLRSHCPTLMNIVDETEATLGDKYPGRHLPYDHFEGRSGWRYIMLRILDEEFHTSSKHLTKAELEHNIFCKCRNLSIEIPNHVVEGIWNDRNKVKGPNTKSYFNNVLTKDCKILDRLISATIHGEYRYTNKSFDRCGQQGNVYREAIKHDNNGMNFSSGRVTAFMVTMEIKEASKIKDELSDLKEECLKVDNKSFLERYPLLSVFLMLHPAENFKRVTYTDLETISYLPASRKKKSQEILE